MELDRPIRYLEVAIALIWILCFYVRMRSLRAGPARENWTQGLRANVRPLQLATLGVLLVCVPLWANAAWQPLAHAFTVPTAVAWGMSQVLLSLASRGATQTRPAGQPTHQPTA
jgi:hypothetical protein